jgi:hypothetical protein
MAHVTRPGAGNTRGPRIRLPEIGEPLVRALGGGLSAFEARYAARPGPCLAHVRDVARQNLDLSGSPSGRGHVASVLAHTRPHPSASTRVLEKAGLRLVGKALDPEDGPVWRWERALDRGRRSDGRCEKGAS